MNDLCCSEKQLWLSLLQRRHSSVEDKPREMLCLSYSQTKNICVWIFIQWLCVSWFDKSIQAETIWLDLDVKHAQTVTNSELCCAAGRSGEVIYPHLWVHKEMSSSSAEALSMHQLFTIQLLLVYWCHQWHYRIFRQAFFLAVCRENKILF